MNRILLSVFLIAGLGFCFAQNDLETVLQKGHSKYVTAFDFHPELPLGVSGGYDNSLILWQTNSGKEIRNFNCHSKSILSVDFSKDGKHILSVSSDKTACISEILTGKTTLRIDLKKMDIFKGYYDGEHIIFLSSHLDYFIYNAENGQRIAKFNKPYARLKQENLIHSELNLALSSSSKEVFAIHIPTKDTLFRTKFDKPHQMGFSPDGRKIIISSTKQFAKIFDVQSQKELQHFEDKASGKICDGCKTKWAMNHNQKLIATTSSRNNLIVWDANSGKIKKTLDFLKGHTDQMIFNQEGNKLLVSIDDKIKVYDVNTGREITSISQSFLEDFEIRIASNQHFFALPNEMNSIAFWSDQSLKKKKVLRGFLNHKKDDGLRFSYTNWTDPGILKYISMSRKFAVSPNGEHVVIGNVDSTALVLDRFTGKIIHRLKGHRKIVLAMNYSSDNKYLVTADGAGNVRIWNAETYQLIRSKKLRNYLIFDVDFNHAKTEVATSCWDGSIAVWNWKENTVKTKSESPIAPYNIGYTPNDLYIVSGNLENNFSFIEADALENFRGLIGHKNIVSDFSFNSNGSQIATSSWDGKVKTWDVLTGMQTNKHQLHFGQVYSVTWLSENLIASGGADNKIVVWDMQKNIQKFELLGHNNPVTHLEFSEKENKLISMSSEGMLIEWDLNTGKEIYSRIQISSDEWLSTSPNGAFNGSANSLNVVNYVSGFKVSPIGSLFNKYFTPTLIQKINEGQIKTDTGEKIKELIEHKPLVELSIHQEKSKPLKIEEDSVYRWKTQSLPLEVQINSQDETIEEIRIYNNGKLVKMDVLNEEIVFRGGKKDAKTYSVPLIDGVNKISARVLNSKRTESDSKEMKISFDGESTKTDLFVLAIGINTYQNSSLNLDYAVNDAKAFVKALKKGADTLFNEVYIESIANANATKESIEQKIKEIQNKIGPEDVFVFYYAGHGTMSYESEKDKEEFFLVTHNVTNLYADYAEIQEKAISAKKLMEYSSTISASKQLFVLDACHSGGALKSFKTRGGGREKALAQLARSTGTFFLTASQDAQYANEVGDLKHGLFTYALLEILEGKIKDNGDEKITVNEMKSHVEDRVPELTEIHRGSAQYPTSYSFGQDFPLVILK